MILTLHFVDYLKRCECGNLSDALGITYNLICLNLHKPVYNVACKLLRSLNKCLPFLILIHVHLLNLNMITIVNPSVKNPGPKQISVLYSNIQGLINTRDLASDQPPLNMTKIHEIGGYLISHKPDIVILNETWLKKVIRSNSVLPKIYKSNRLKRSSGTHPYDPKNPKKFRKNGGGVAIAYRRNINLEAVKFIKCNVQAEILTLNFKLDTGKTFSISTFYRVNNLGVKN